MTELKNKKTAPEGTAKRKKKLTDATLDSNLNTDKRVVPEQNDELKKAGVKAIEQLEKSYQAVAELSDKRLSGKLSNSRVAAIARELKELIKVLSMYTI